MKKSLFRVPASAFLQWVNENKIGLVAITVATAFFFAPLLPRLATYSEGGDAMFNAWLISRNHNCILQNGCPDYTTANIYYPNQDTMLYSETELSAAVLTLPLHFIDKNPIFSYNVWTILSFLFSGIFMYMLAKYINKGNELFSVLAGLVFAFAPIKMAAVSHLQNLSIFYLPLIVLFILKYFKEPQKRYLILLYIVLVLQFYASWYQMVFVLLPVGGLILARIFTNGGLRTGLQLSGVVIAAVITTIPLAIEYVQFSKASGAAFSMLDQVKYSSSLKDYIIPYEGTVLGKVYYALFPDAQRNAYNPDSFSYVGFSLLLVAAISLLLLFRRRKERLFKVHHRLVVPLLVVGLAAFIVSLGPVLKIDGKPLDYIDPVSGTQVLFPLPYILIDKFLPQLSFIRAIGRIAIILLFVLCCILALLPRLIADAKLSFSPFRQKVAAVLLLVLVALEMLPVHHMIMSKQAYHYDLHVPEVYEHIRRDDEVRNFVILASDPDYPGATIPTQRAEWVLWAGYHNKNIFNGYSGYTPVNYFNQYGDFLDFNRDDVDEIERLGLDHVLVDKQLSKTDTRVLVGAKTHLKNITYEDDRYILYSLK